MIYKHIEAAVVQRIHLIQTFRPTFHQARRLSDGQASVEIGWQGLHLSVGSFLSDMDIMKSKLLPFLMNVLLIFVHIIQIHYTPVGLLLHGKMTPLSL